MNEFIEKLIGRLEEHKTKAYVTGFTNNPYELGACHAMDDAVKIVNQLAEEYKEQNIDQDLMIVVSLPSLYPMMQPFEVEAIHRVASSAKYSGGWIPCSKQLPPHSDDLLLIQCSGKPKNNIVFENAFCLASYIKEGWLLELYPEWKGAEVIAWMPLPEPFKPIAE